MTKTSYAPKPETIVTAAEVAEAMALLKGEPVMTFELPAPTLIRDEAGGFHVSQGSVWVKLSVSFREVMPQLKGAPLAVFLSICLHVNGGGEAWPQYDTICAETGYAREAVAAAIKHLESIPGLLTITRRDGTSNLYRPAYIAYGKDPQVKSNYTPPEKRTTPPPKSELKEEPLTRTNEVERTPAADYYFQQFGRKRWNTPAQAELFASIEAEVGADVMMRAVKWAGEKNLPDLHALKTTAKKMATGPRPAAGKPATGAGPWARRSGVSK